VFEMFRKLYKNNRMQQTVNTIPCQIESFRDCFFR
jgi:hypothetical protein